MKTLQYCGPFGEGDIKEIELPDFYRAIQIGIEHPFSIPIGEFQSGNSNLSLQGDLLIEIDGEPFKLNECDMLEYDGLYQRKMKIKFLKAVDAYTIIDIIFKSESE